MQTGRETLQRTIAHVNQHPSWGARVIYGDTDSLFVLLEGQSRQQAFITGRQIAAEVRPLIACSLETYGLSVRIAYGCH